MMNDIQDLVDSLRKKAPLYGAFFLLLLLLSCQNRDTASGKAGQNPFFDLNSYFNEQIERLQTQQPEVRKTVTFDGETETLELDSLDYERELEVFLNADLNRASWWDKYTIDSSRTDGRLASIVYTAQEEDLRVKKLRIEFEKEEVSRIEVESSTKGPTGSRKQSLLFEPEQGYRIHTQQKVVFSKPREMEIEVRFE